jgi:hypothetical protein
VPSVREDTQPLRPGLIDPPPCRGDLLSGASGSAGTLAGELLKKRAEWPTAHCPNFLSG